MSLDGLFTEKLLDSPYSYKALNKLVLHLKVHNYKDTLSTYEWLKQIAPHNENHDLLNLCLAARDKGTISVAVYEKIKTKLTNEGIFSGGGTQGPNCPMNDVFLDLLFHQEYERKSIDKIIKNLRRRNYDKTISTYDWFQQVANYNPAVLNLCIAARDEKVISVEVYEQIKKKLIERGIVNPPPGAVEEEKNDLSGLFIDLLLNQKYTDEALNTLIEKLKKNKYDKVLSSYEYFKQVAPQYHNILNLCIAARDDAVITADNYQEIKKKLIEEGVFTL